MVDKVLTGLLVALAFLDTYLTVVTGYVAYGIIAALCAIVAVAANAPGLDKSNSD